MTQEEQQELQSLLGKAQAHYRRKGDYVAENAAQILRMRRVA